MEKNSLFLKTDDDLWNEGRPCDLDFIRQSEDICVYLDGFYFFRDLSFPSNKETLSDSIAECYRNGFEKIGRLIDGAYTILIVDRRRKTISALTDPYGLNRIYYAMQGNSLLLSNRIQLILDCIGEKINSDALGEYLRFLDISPPMTLFDGVQCLEPGKILSYSIVEGCTCLEKDGNKNTPDKIYNEDLEKAADELDALLVRGLEQRMRGKTGLLLSGGIDSSLLAALIPKAGKKSSTVAYTIGFDRPDLDESSIAAAVAAHVGIDHKVLQFTIDEEFKQFGNIVNCMEVPFADPAIVPTILALTRMHENGIEIVMEGTGADGNIGYMPSKYHQIILKYASHIPSIARKTLLTGLYIWGDPGGLAAYLDFDEPQEKFIRWRGWHKDEIEELCGFKPDFKTTSFYKTFSDYKDRGAYELYRNLMISMPDYRITETCKFFGFSPAFPFFDIEIRSFIASLPIEYKYKDGTNKVIYRKLLGRYIPEAIWSVPKHGFDFPFERLLQYQDFALLKTYLSNDALGIHGLFDYSIVKKCVDRFVLGDMTVRFKIWALLIFQAYLINRKGLH